MIFITHNLPMLATPDTSDPPPPPPPVHRHNYPGGLRSAQADQVSQLRQSPRQFQYFYLLGGLTIWQCSISHPARCPGHHQAGNLFILLFPDIVTDHKYPGPAQSHCGLTSSRWGIFGIFPRLGVQFSSVMIDFQFVQKWCRPRIFSLAQIFQSTERQTHLSLSSLSLVFLNLVTDLILCTYSNYDKVLPHSRIGWAPRTSNSSWIIE